MRRNLLAVLTLATTAAWAASPATDVWIPSVGHGPGTPPTQWRTDVWVSLPSGTAPATVDIYFLPRAESNAWPPESRRITVNPGETREFLDIVKNLFNKDNAFGALRFVADREVLVTSRIYNAGVAGSTGQFFAGLPATAAIGTGQSTDIQGLEQSSSFRSNVGWVEVSGNPCAIQVQRIDGNGVTVASQTYQVQPYAVVQKNQVLNELGGPGANQRLRISVVSGSGKVLAFGSRIDNASQDPSTIEMRTPPLVDRSQGFFAGALGSGNAITGGLSFQLSAGAISEFQGNGLVDCGGTPFALDFGPNSTPVVLDSNGAFSFALTHDYYDEGGTKVLTVTWTASGTVAPSGTGSGVMTGEVTFKASTQPWTTCTGLIQSWQAGWVAP